MKPSKTAQTIAAYNHSAAEYAEKFGNYLPYKSKMAAFQRKYIPPQATILDLGCGPGNNIKTISELDDSCHFTGVDMSAKLLDRARQAFPRSVFWERDMRRIDLASQFDVVIASFCIVHLTNEEVEPFIKRIAELLVDHGHLYLSFMEGDRDGFETTSFSNEKIYFNYFPVAFIRGILERHAIKPLELSKEEYLERDGSTTNDIFIYARKVV